MVESGMKFISPPQAEWTDFETTEWVERLCRKVGTQVANQPASTATTVAEVVTDLNTLLAAMKSANIMVGD